MIGERYFPFLRRLLRVLSDTGTEEIRSGAEEISRLSDEEIKGRLSPFLEGKEVGEVERLIFLSWLQPILHTFADRIEISHERWLKNVCPVCGSKPSVSFLMDTSEWEGARFLRCSLCLTDWLYERTKCAVCGNNEDDKLSYYTSEEVKHVELQVCNLCNNYIKS
ncbi:MAG: formate dehydrogenase accessory protein FdhE [Aquificota bacterium]|nr:formate dehydrogenase accessory protein FdhE [Aquificota bacterium]